MKAPISLDFACSRPRTMPSVITGSHPHEPQHVHPGPSGCPGSGRCRIPRRAVQPARNPGPAKRRTPYTIQPNSKGENDAVLCHFQRIHAMRCPPLTDGESAEPQIPGDCRKFCDGENGRILKSALMQLAARVSTVRAISHKKNAGTALLRNDSSVGTFEWRRGRDSNPRYAFDVQRLSRAPPSATRSPLR